RGRARKIILRFGNQAIPAHGGGLVAFGRTVAGGTVGAERTPGPQRVRESLGRSRVESLIQGIELMQLATPSPVSPPPDPALQARLDALLAEGWEIWDRFDREVRDLAWHPFVAADYERVLATLITLRAPGKRFLEWGSATGVITIMADMLGFEACGIELDAGLV